MSVVSEPVTDEPDSKARLRLWLRLLKVSRMVEGNLRERLRVEFKSTLPRFDVMAALQRHGDGLKMSELSGVLKVSNGNVTGIVDRLSEDGMVVRVPVKGDRRAMRVQLTDAGQAHFVTLAEQHENWIDALLSEFSVEESGDIAARLHHLTEMIESDQT